MLDDALVKELTELISSFQKSFIAGVQNKTLEEPDMPPLRG